MNIQHDLAWMAYHRRMRSAVITAAQAVGAVALALLGWWCSL